MPWAKIDNELGIIRNNTYGENVRWAIHDAIKKINDELPDEEPEPKKEED
ncbi:MAG: hypothetical protein J6U54_17520 [Clostridiales bacterium]|nr:hypothetical protein [Clostridiales bacterium]